MLTWKFRPDNKAYWFRLDENGASGRRHLQVPAGYSKDAVVAALGLKPGDFVGLTAGNETGCSEDRRRAPQDARRICPKAHMKKDCYEFCWIVDFPMYEIGEESGELEFCHNPFSMPQGGTGRSGEAGSAGHSAHTSTIWSATV